MYLDKYGKGGVHGVIQRHKSDDNDSDVFRYSIEIQAAV